MAKLVLDDVTRADNVQKINSNFTKIEDELQSKVLYRDNPTGEPNQMENDIDLNNNDLLNVGLLSATDITINGLEGVGQGVITSAKEWAVQLDAKVSDADYSSKEWAIGTTVESGSAKDWSTQVGATVDGTNYSSKEWAVGTTVADGSSKEWATVTGSTVDGSEYSAKEWSVGAAVPSGSSKEWATTTGATVDGSDYSSKEWAVGTAVPSGSSKDWSVTAEDVLVDGVEYSSKHYAAKTAADRAYIDTKIDGAGIIPATTEASGIVEKATTAEAEAGTADKFPDAAGVAAHFAATEQQIGVSQTWQNVSASRASGVIYTNTTGRPIQVFIPAYGTINFKINGQLFLQSAAADDDIVIQAVIPDGDTYEITPTAFRTWWELR